MRKIVLVMLLAGLALGHSAPSISVGLNYARGHSLYYLMVAEPLQYEDSYEPPSSTGDLSVTGESELIFPLNFPILTLGLRWPLGSGENPRHFFAKAGMALMNPEGKMEDSDWFGVQAKDGGTTVQSRQKYSYTESISKGYYGELQLGLEFPGVAIRSWLIDVMGRIQVRHGVFDIYGADGWQLDPYWGGRSSLSLSDDLHVLYYEFSYAQLDLGGYLKLWESGAHRWRTLVFATPLAYGRDYDNHLLRGKYSRAQNFGVGFGCESQLDLALGSGFQLELGFQYERQYLWGSMDQTYYDPSPELDPVQADILKGIETKMQLLQWRLQIAISRGW